jgi:hypothetical protein
MYSVNYTSWEGIYNNWQHIVKIIFDERKYLECIDGIIYARDVVNFNQRTNNIKTISRNWTWHLDIYFANVLIVVKLLILILVFKSFEYFLECFNFFLEFKISIVWIQLFLIVIALRNLFKDYWRMNFLGIFKKSPEMSSFSFDSRKNASFHISGISQESAFTCLGRSKDN